MNNSKILIERVSGVKNVVRIPLLDVKDSQAILEVLREAFDKCFTNGDNKIIVDLQKLQFPTSSLIALLIEATSRARKLNGDVKIINLSHSAKNNLTTFSPLSYLSIEKDEKYAINDFNDFNDFGHDEIKTVIPEEDIVDDPIVQKLQDTYSDLPLSKDVKIDQEVKKHTKTKIKSNHLRVKSITNNLYKICDFVTSDAEKAGFTIKEIGKTRIAVYEACLNIIEHAYHSNPDNWIDVWVEYNSKVFTILIKDYGVGFEDLKLKEYDVLTAMDHRQTGGFGLYIIKRAMDEIEYQSDKVNGNVLKLVKYIKKK